MSEQLADIATLTQLVQSMTQLHEYCLLLQQGAQSFAAVLPAEWQGAAMASFEATFQQWSAQATTLAEAADGLTKHSQLVLQAYQQTIDALNTAWTDFSAQLA